MWVTSWGPWLFAVQRGWNTTQLIYRDYNKACKSGSRHESRSIMECHSRVLLPLLMCDASASRRFLNPKKSFTTQVVDWNTLAEKITHENRPGPKRKGSSSNRHYSRAMLNLRGVFFSVESIRGCPSWFFEKKSSMQAKWNEGYFLEISPPIKEMMPNLWAYFSKMGWGWAWEVMCSFHVCIRFIVFFSAKAVPRSKVAMSKNLQVSLVNLETLRSDWYFLD